MCTQRQLLTYWVTLLMVLPGLAVADTVLDYDFSDGSGTIVTDLSGSGNDGELMGFADTSAGAGAFNSSEGWVAGGGLSFLDDGVRSYVETPVSLDSLPGDFTLEFEANYAGASGWAPVFGSTAGGCCGQSIFFGVHQDQSNIEVRIQNSGGPVGPHPWGAPDEAVFHVALVYDGATDGVETFVDGVSVGTGSKGSANMAATPTLFRIGNVGWSSGEQWDGILFGVAISDEKLGPDSFVIPNRSKPTAWAPKPADGANDIPRDTTLSWSPGEFAATHDVYLGTSWDDVNDSIAGALLAGELDVNSLDPGRLDYGQTYHWRVDEVNAAPGKAVFAGDIWDFTVEPFAYPLQPIAATASSAHADNLGPENTINGSGLDAADQHGTLGTDMWLSGMGDLNPVIQYEFDAVYKLDQLMIWNSNQLIEAFVGLGAKDVMIETSIDGSEWVVLEEATQLAQAPGTADYTANTIVDFRGTMASSVRITVKTGWGAVPQYGLSEVRFLYIPVQARQPQPADGVVAAGVDVTLRWRVGREAASHQVYLGTDAENLPLAGTTEVSSFDADALNYGTTYYWSVTEVNEVEAVSSYAGDTWSFNTPAFGVVDNFDQYNDNCKRIFFAWADGLGHNGGTEIDDCDVPPSSGNGGGSIVGHAQAPFAERVIVNTGSVQSLPLSYDNAFGPSEATLVLPGQDWIASGIQTLSLMFRGGAGNTGQLYLKINNAKVLYDQDPADIARPVWQAWNIDLTGIAGLQNVSAISVGVDGANAAGMLYVDDIRLYPVAGALIAPEAPDGAHLVAHYTLDGNVEDSSPNGQHGTSDSLLTYVTGVEGQALQLNGLEFIDFGSPAHWPSGTSPRSLCAWGLTSSIAPGWRWIAAYGQGATGQAMFIGINGSDLFGGGYGDDVSSPDFWAVEEWHHIGLSYDGSTARLYADGVEVAASAKNWNLTMDRAHIGRQVNDAAEFWEGLVDDVRVYDQALSPEEMLWLAGRTTAAHKPF